MYCLIQSKQPCKLLLSNLTSQFRSLSLSGQPAASALASGLCDRLQAPSNVHLQIRTSTSFFTRLPGDTIWKGVTSVSNAGKKRGRGKGAGKRIAKDLNKGQVIGVGRVNMVWPGLNTSVIRGKELVEQKKLPADKDYFLKLLKVRNEMDTFHRTRMHSLERGWAGTTQPGRWIGPPDPILDEKFEGFDTKVLMLQNQFCMKANTGKTRSVKTICVTGAKNGLAGFAVGKAKDGRTALKKAKNLAAQRLRYFELYEGHTLMHDFSSQYGAVRVNAFKKPPGYGIVAQRAIKAICEVIGIKDIYVKAEGAQTHTLHVVRAFFLGLANQKSFQEMADDKKLHLVELKEETDYFPKVLASPSDGVVRTEREIPPDENTDFRMYINNGNIIQIPPRKYPDYTRTAGYLKFLQKWHYHRSRQDVRVYLKAKHGKLDTFLLERERKERAQRKVALALESPKEEATASS